MRLSLFLFAVLALVLCLAPAAPACDETAAALRGNYALLGPYPFGYVETVTPAPTVLATGYGLPVVVPADTYDPVGLRVGVRRAQLRAAERRALRAEIRARQLRRAQLRALRGF